MPALTTATRESRKAAKLASLTIIGRATFKSTGSVLYGVRSGETIYHLTMIAGKIRSCVDSTTGESCKAHQYRGTCCHEERVMLAEAVRQMELDTAAAVAKAELSEMGDDLTAHIEDGMLAQPEPEQPVTIDAASVPFTNPIDKVYSALTFGTVNSVRDLCAKTGMMDHMVANCITALSTSRKIVMRDLDDDRVWIDTPAHAYSTTYPGDYEAA